MSVRAELEELIKWLSDLTAEDKPAPAVGKLYLEQWRTVETNLTTAAKNLHLARTKLSPSPVTREPSAPLFMVLLMRRRKPPPSVLHELAQDLQREAENLALRARMLSGRADNRPPKKAPRSKLCVRNARNVATPSKPTAGSAKSGASDRAAVYARRGLEGIERAHEHLLAVAHPDAVTQAFEAEVDVLAEMTLSLAQQCETSDDRAEVA